MTDDIRAVDAGDPTSHMTVGEFGDAMLASAGARDDRPEPPAPVVNPLPGEASTVLADLGFDPEEIGRVVAAHPEAFPEGSVTTAEDFRRVAHTANEISIRDQAVARADHKRRTEALYAATERYEYAVSDDEIYDSLSALANEIGDIHDPLFVQFVQTVAGDDGAGDAAVVEEWLDDLSQQNAEATRVARESNAIEALVKQAAAHAKLGEELNERSAAFKERNAKRIARNGSTPAEVLSNFDLTNIRSADELETHLEVALNAAEKINAADAINLQMEKAFHNRLLLDYGGQEFIPEHDPVMEADLSDVMPKAPRAERVDTFLDAFEKATTPHSAALAAEMDAEANRAQKRKPK